MEFSQEKPGAEAAASLLRWFEKNRRPFPWRQTSDPYAIWISEVMLQQTQASRAAEYFLRWMDLFPTLVSLAEAGEDLLLKAWEGLGYYSRARNLKKAALSLLAQGRSSLPQSLEDLIQLPGVGPYTAGAVASIAFGIPVPAVDANVRRVFSRLLDLEMPPGSRRGEELIREHLTGMIPKEHPGDFNQAVMELGATVCLPASADCGSCPLSPVCLARSRGSTFLRPVKPRGGTGRTAEGRLFVLLHEGRVFLRRRPGNGLWANFEEFPWEAPPLEPSLPEWMPLPEKGSGMAVPERIRFSVTRWRVTLQVFVLACGKEPPLFPAQQGRWANGRDLAAISLPAGSRKARELLRRGRIIPFLPEFSEGGAREGR